MTKDAWQDIAEQLSHSKTSEPPSIREERRNGVLVAALIIIALVLGWQVKEAALSATAEAPLGGQLPVLIYPANWLPQQAEGVLFRAINPRSKSSFDARIEVYSRDLREGEDMEMLSASWPLRRSKELEKYRNLSTEIMAGPDGQPALLITYAYLADPTRELGAAGLPVVVQAQDLIFIDNDGANDRLVVITVAADATEWAQQEPVFKRLFERLGVQGGES